MKKHSVGLKYLFSSMVGTKYFSKLMLFISVLHCMYESQCTRVLLLHVCIIVSLFVRPCRTLSSRQLPWYCSSSSLVAQLPVGECLVLSETRSAQYTVDDIYVWIYAYANVMTTRGHPERPGYFT